MIAVGAALDSDKVSRPPARSIVPPVNAVSRNDRVGCRCTRIDSVFAILMLFAPALDRLSVSVPPARVDRARRQSGGQHDGVCRRRAEDRLRVRDIDAVGARARTGSACRARPPDRSCRHSTPFCRTIVSASAPPRMDRCWRTLDAVGTAAEQAQRVEAAGQIDRARGQRRQEHDRGRPLPAPRIDSVFRHIDAVWRPRSTGSACRAPPARSIRAGRQRRQEHDRVGRRCAEDRLRVRDIDAVGARARQAQRVEPARQIDRRDGLTAIRTTVSADAPPSRDSTLATLTLFAPPLNRLNVSAPPAKSIVPAASAVSSTIVSAHRRRGSTPCSRHDAVWRRRSTGSACRGRPPGRPCRRSALSAAPPCRSPSHPGSTRCSRD